MIVLAAEETEGFPTVAKEYGLRKVSAVVSGAGTRAGSVLNGLKRINAESVEIVAVHDGVRPFVTAEEISRTVTAAKLEGAAVLVSAPVDTVKEINDGAIKRTLERAIIRNALTPQCFNYELLLRAYEQADLADPGLTDDSSLVERLGARVAIVEGSPRNIKITKPEDLAIGEVLLKEIGGQ
jgi:2-C-methyl-D-erythritol 4-phosphate cytidylyltransferase